MKFMENLTGMQLDVLGEIGNISTAKAATSLSTLLNKRVQMEVPKVKIVDFPEMLEITGGSEQVIVSVFMEMKGEVEGNLFFVMLPQQAERFVLDMMNGNRHNPILPEELSHSVLKEVGNILGGAYVAALSDLTHLEIHMSVPSLAIDMAGALLTIGLLGIAEQSDQALIIDTTIQGMTGDKYPIDIFFFLLPHPDSCSKIFSALGVQHGE